MITLQVMGMYPSWLNWAFTIVLSLSISLAMYSLIVFYHVFAEELKPHEPLSKFISIKGIVFLGFWQVNAALAVLIYMNFSMSRFFVHILYESYMWEL